VKLEEFTYELPEERIAQYPAAGRSASRLLLVDRGGGGWRDDQFRELPELLRGDEVLVLNNARVFPARLLGRREGVWAEARGRRGRGRRQHLAAPIEVLLLRRLDEGKTWDVLVRPGRKVRTGEVLIFGEGELTGKVLTRGEYGLRRVRFTCRGGFEEAVERLGHVPLPPYIDRGDEPEDRVRYQTVFARRGRAVAAPTAGLHFTAEILEGVRQRGCEIVEITLEVGYGTFQPLRSGTVERHQMHAEPYEIPPEAASAIERARAEGRPVLAVGTSVVRTLEDCAARQGGIVPGRGLAQLYICPGHRFRVVDQLLTNFHLPCSSLLILVCAFAGRENVLRVYAHAVKEKYRFYSYGDCMLIR
jgi:S-adenosylmethionine:tRNA ribosyltransferase-isomerase